jgi:hypothetical protein
VCDMNRVGAKAARPNPVYGISLSPLGQFVICC